MSERRQNPRGAPVVLLLIAALLCAAPARSPAADPQPADDEWTFIVAPYAWLLAVEGDASYRGTKADVDQNFSDILSKLDVVLEGRLEARKGGWTLFLDPTISLLRTRRADTSSFEKRAKYAPFPSGGSGSVGAEDVTASTARAV